MSNKLSNASETLAQNCAKINDVINQFENDCMRVIREKANNLKNQYDVQSHVKNFLQEFGTNDSQSMFL